MKPLIREVFSTAHVTGNFLVEAFQSLALFVIGASTIWSAGWFYAGLIQQGHASLEDLLLLFIYLEVGAMTGIYFKTKHLPIRFIIYIAITAIARYLIVDIDHIAPLSVLMMSASVVILICALWIEHKANKGGESDA